MCIRDSFRTAGFAPFRECGCDARSGDARGIVATSNVDVAVALPADYLNRCGCGTRDGRLDVLDMASENAAGRSTRRNGTDPHAGAIRARASNPVFFAARDERQRRGVAAFAARRPQG